MTIIVYTGNTPTDLQFVLSGKGPSQPAPKIIGNLIAFILNLVSIIVYGALRGDTTCAKLNGYLFNLVQIGPKGLEFARYSLDYHTIRNYLYVNRTWGRQR